MRYFKQQINIECALNIDYENIEISNLDTSIVKNRCDFSVIELHFTTIRLLQKTCSFNKSSWVFGGFLVNQLYRVIGIERPDIELNPKS